MKLTRSFFHHLNFHQVSWLLFVCLFSLGQLGHLHIVANISVYLHDVLLVIWLIGTGLYDAELRLFLRRKMMHLPREVWFLSFWIGLGILVALGQHFSIGSAVLYLGRLLLYVSTGFLLCYLFMTQKILLRFGWWGVSVVCLHIVLFGFLQYFLLPDTRFLFFLGWDDHYYRLLSTFLDPGFTGILLVLCLFFMQWLVQQLRLSVTQRVAAQFFSTLILGTALLLTYSRASYLALAAGTVVIFVAALRKHRLPRVLPLMIGCLILAGLIPFLPRPGGEGVKLERSSTITARESSMQSELAGVHDFDWIVGQGLFVNRQSNTPSLYETPQHNQVPDNWLVMLLTQTGVVGTGLALATLCVLLVKMFKRNVWWSASLVAVLLHGFFNASLVYPFVVLFLATFWAISRATSLSKVHR